MKSDSLTSLLFLSNILIYIADGSTTVVCASFAREKFLVSCQVFGHHLQPVYGNRPYVHPSKWPTHLLTEGSYPFMHRESEQPIQSQPFMSEFANGFAMGNPKIKYLRGQLNIPNLYHRAMWDMNGQLRVGPTLTHYNWRNQVAPLNSLNLSPAAQRVIQEDPAFRTTIDGRSGAAGLGHCGSAYCAPTEPGVDAAMVYQMPKNVYANGKLDFPVFTGNYGEGYKFARSFDIFAGRHPTTFTFSEHTNPFVHAMMQHRMQTERDRALKALDNLEQH